MWRCADRLANNIKVPRELCESNSFGLALAVLCCHTPVGLRSAVLCASNIENIADGHFHCYCFEAFCNNRSHELVFCVVGWYFWFENDTLLHTVLLFIYLRARIRALFVLGFARHHSRRRSAISLRNRVRGERELALPFKSCQSPARPLSDAVCIQKHCRMHEKINRCSCPSDISVRCVVFRLFSSAERMKTVSFSIENLSCSR